ncbi:fungal-specific transcription factor domain-containing protein [Aspergillus cavernicola]|uniref:Fungal-specific transcription factor domain-containing protein n=1 Tax=Aspergillus cavernicola TaxID=176166 RepID=A0ABR4HZI9_9EURO
MIINREIQRLQNRVKDLQEQIRRAKERVEIQSQVQAPNEPQTSYATPPHSDTVGGSFSYAELSNTKEEWQITQQSGARDGGLYYGPMSSTQFVARITRYLSHALNQSWGDTKLEACVARFDDTPASRQPSRSDVSQGNNQLGGADHAEILLRSQEEFFLNLLWQSFHCVFPVISEPDFRQYYDSLWSNYTLDGNRNPTRKPSPLVDILLAVCMQYGSTFLINDDNHREENDTGSHARNADMTGHAFYQRAQRLLQTGLERPSIIVLQSHIYSIIYLYNASLLNTAHINLGMTLRIAHALRLHVRPLDGTRPREQELNRRIWWTLYRLDSQLSTTLGRPPLIQMSTVSCGLSSDDREDSILSGTALISRHEDISWLSFHVQCTKLLFAVQSVQSAFQRKCSLLLNRNNINDIHDDPLAIEALAEFLGHEMTTINDWIQAVPQSLRVTRRGEGEALSTDRAPLSLDMYNPLWLQRQQLLLELLYHHLQISTLRSFLRFPPVTASLTPLADSHSISCVNHAMAITSILSQVLCETDLLRGWLPVFQYQWDAILCTLGFVLANPICPPTPSARKSLKTAICTLELIGNYFPAARNAAQVVCEINCHANRLIETFRQSLTGK